MRSSVAASERRGASSSMFSNIFSGDLQKEILAGLESKSLFRLAATSRSMCSALSAAALGRLLEAGRCEVQFLRGVGKEGKAPRVGEIAEEHDPAAVQFYNPCHMSVDEELGRVRVVDYDNDRVLVLDLEGKLVRVLGGRSGNGIGEFKWPIAVTAAPGSDILYIADCANDRIVVMRENGRFLFSFGAFGTGPGQLDGPNAIAMGKNGWLYVSDGGNDRIQVFGRDGRHKHSFGTSGDGKENLRNPSGITIVDDTIYVADCFNARVQILSTDGTFLRSFGGVRGADEGQFDSPRGVAVLGSRLFVTDTGNGRVQVLDRHTGAFVCCIGSQGDGDGQFNLPRGIASFGGDRIVVSSNHRIQVFSTGLLLSLAQLERRCHAEASPVKLAELLRVFQRRACKRQRALSLQAQHAWFRPRRVYECKEQHLDLRKRVETLRKMLSKRRLEKRPFLRRLLVAIDDGRRDGGGCAAAAGIMPAA